jgi:myo-inositol-1(or 4)-monophosphatase
MHPIVNIAVKAARRAGSIIIRNIDRIDQINIQQKGDNDFVSEVDRLAENEIIAIIQAAYPSHHILAEESGKTAATAVDPTSPDQYEWLIDPLDGTTNYLHQNPNFVVSIGVLRNGVLEHGVIFDPLREELYTASRGGGAQLNGRRIRVSKTLKLRQSLIATDFPYQSLHNSDQWFRIFKTIMPKSNDMRVTGAAALDLAYLACGRIDGFWELGLKPWDLAAGCLLVQEAGGFIADFQGKHHFLRTGNIVAGNPKIFSELLNVVVRRSDIAKT